MEGSLERLSRSTGAPPVKRFRFAKPRARRPCYGHFSGFTKCARAAVSFDPFSNQITAR
jgi:hypothetical protein